MLATIIAGFGVFLGVCALIVAAQAHRVARTTSHRRCKAAQAELRTDLAQAQDTVERISKALRKMQMRRVGEKRHENRPADGLPDPKTDPEGWKKHMRMKLQRQTLKIGA